MTNNFYTNISTEYKCNQRSKLRVAAETPGVSIYNPEMTAGRLKRVVYIFMCLQIRLHRRSFLILKQTFMPGLSVSQCKM